MRARLATIAALLFIASVARGQSWAQAPWLGVRLAPGVSGAKVKVVPETPAEKAGLVDGDEILSIDDAVTRTTAELIATVATHRVGDEVTLTVQRGGKQLELTATLGRKPDTRNVARKVLIDRPAPDFDLDVVSGKGSGKFSDYGGVVVVVEFFATWCKYCPLMHKQLAALQKQYKDDVIVVGIASDDKQKLLNYLDPDYAPITTTVTQQVGKDSVSKTVQLEPHYGELGFRVLHDIGEKVKRAYWVSTLPAVVVIDREGFVRDIGVGASNAVARQIQRSVAQLVDDD